MTRFRPPFPVLPVVRRSHPAGRMPRPGATLRAPALSTRRGAVLFFIAANLAGWALLGAAGLALTEALP